MNILEENIVLKNLILMSEYFDKVFPYLKKDYFQQNCNKKIFNCIRAYNEKYNRKPTLPVLKLFAEQVQGVNEKEYKEILDVITFIEKPETYEFDWLCDETLKFIQNRDYYNAMCDAVSKYDKNELDTELPEKLNKAFSISFDSTIGMEFSDAEERWNAYTEHEDKVPFSLTKLNEITKDGVTRKTLNCLMSSKTGGFKSGSLCSFSSDYIRLGYNVLYLTFEMAESKILERIDANLLDTPIDDLVKLGKNTYLSKIDVLKKQTQGRLLVKQFPTSMVHVGHIRALLKELRLKKNFVPDIIIFDYIGIMISQRYNTHNAPEHQIIKAVTEEVRGLCVEYNVVGWTAMQSNRGGYEAETDLSLADISASFSSSFGFDLILGVITSTEFDNDNKILFSQLKNRYGDINQQTKIFLGLSKPKMKLFDLAYTSDSDFVKEASDTEKDIAESKVFSDKYHKVKDTNFVF